MIGYWLETIVILYSMFVETWRHLTTSEGMHSYFNIFQLIFTHSDYELW